MIREISLEDEMNYGTLLKTLEEETDFLLLEPNERKASKEKTEKMIDMFIAETNSTILEQKRTDALHVKIIG